MQQLVILAQALGVAYASGISVYATVALLGIAQRMEWIAPLPDALSVVGNEWVIGIAGTLYLFEMLATLVPGVASLWETFHSLVRPPAAAALAVLTAWQGDALFTVVAGLLGGTLAVGTHATKLGLRYAIDTSPEPVTNGVANTAELGVVWSCGASDPPSGLAPMGTAGGGLAADPDNPVTTVPLHYLPATCRPN